MKKYVQKFLITTALGMVAASAETDCVALSQAVNFEVAAEKARVLEIVTKHVAAAPECACEVVKTAIKASNANKQAVAAIVEAAIISAPAQMRVITQCAIATAPDAASDIQAVLSKIDPNGGETAHTSKSGKAPAEVAEESFNPLDFPGDETSTVGPRTGTGGPRNDNGGGDPTGGGDPYLRPGPRFNTPPIIDSPAIGYQQPAT
jgi:hypothetical protein